MADKVAAERTDTIVHEAMAKHHLKAVLAGVAVDRPPRSELMTGAPVSSGYCSFSPTKNSFETHSI